MDKAVMKVLFRAHGLRVTDWVVVLARDWANDARTQRTRIESALSYPVFVKPANMGSSVGISKAHDASVLEEAMALACRFDRKVVVEAAVPDARELEIAVLGNDDPAASVPGEIVPSGEFYDYAAKYLSGDSRLDIPAAVDAAVIAELQRQSVVAFRAIDGAGLARVDFLLSRTTQELFINEINTLPGFTTISMYSKLWTASGVDYPTLVDQLIAFALERHAEKRALHTSAF
jgi:D-alanine-D-alanine ligase